MDNTFQKNFNNRKVTNITTARVIKPRVLYVALMDLFVITKTNALVSIRFTYEYKESYTQD
jgi:hypothetical protein